MHHHRPSATLTLKCPDPETIKEEKVSESESDSYTDEEDDGFQLKKKRLDLDGGSRSKMASAASGRGGGGRAVVPPKPLPFICKVSKCGADLSGCKQYHKKHRICVYHTKAEVALVDGLKQRFCQQCSRFHELKEFDDTRRSCRRRLQGHNARRRKTSMAAGLGPKKDECKIDQEKAGLGPKKDDCRVDQERGRIVMDYPKNHQKIQIL